MHGVPGLKKFENHWYNALSYCHSALQVVLLLVLITFVKEFSRLTARGLKEFFSLLAQQLGSNKLVVVQCFEANGNFFNVLVLGSHSSTNGAACKVHS